MAKSKPEPKGDRYARGLGPAIAALKKHIGKKSLFMPPTRRHIAMPFRELGVLLGGESNPGLPTGVFIEVLGQTGAGKTTFAMALARVVINQPDAEHRGRRAHQEPRARAHEQHQRSRRRRKTTAESET
jgi:hypothetical protein